MRHSNVSAAAALKIVFLLCFACGGAGVHAQAGDALVITTDGKVGIGMSEPKAQLDVAGTVQAGGNIGAPNTLVWSEQPLTGSATLDAGAIGRIHLVAPGAEGGTRITLPSAAKGRGGLIAFVVKPLEAGRPATQTAIESSEKETLDGRPRLVLISGNSLVLLSDGAGWVSLTKKVDTDWVDGGPISVRVAGLAKSPKVESPTKSSETRIDKVRWRRVGDSMEVIWEYAADRPPPLGNAKDAGKGLYLFELPIRVGVDESKLLPFNADRLLARADDFVYDVPNHATPLGYGHVSLVTGTEWGSRLEPLAFAERNSGRPPAVCFVEFYDRVGEDENRRFARYLTSGSKHNFSTAGFAVFARATVPIVDW